MLRDPKRREVRRRLIGTLSKGYRRRVALAGAIVHDPPVLILDEPTSGLDPVQIVEMRKMIGELRGENFDTIVGMHTLEYLEDDELLEVTPKTLRLRKVVVRVGGQQIVCTQHGEGRGTGRAKADGRNSRAIEKPARPSP